MFTMHNSLAVEAETGKNNFPKKAVGYILCFLRSETYKALIVPEFQDLESELLVHHHTFYCGIKGHAGVMHFWATGINGQTPVCLAATHGYEAGANKVLEGAGRGQRVEVQAGQEGSEADKGGS